MQCDEEGKGGDKEGEATKMEDEATERTRASAAIDNDEAVRG